MKSKLLLILGLVALVGVVAVNAATTTITVTGDATNNASTGPLTLTQIQLTSSATNVAYFTLFDAPSTNVTYTLSAYTNNSVSSAITYTNIYTNFFGVIETNTYSAITNVTTAVSASTNSYNRIINQVVVPTNTTTTITLHQQVLNGLLLTNRLPGSATFTYTK